MTEFIADRFLAVPNALFDPLFSLNILDPLAPGTKLLGSLLFHPQVALSQGLIINQFVAGKLKLDVGDTMRLTLVGMRSGGTFPLPRWTIGAVANFSPYVPYIKASADLLSVHFDLSPLDPLLHDMSVKATVHGRKGTCVLSAAAFGP